MLLHLTTAEFAMVAVACFRYTEVQAVGVLDTQFVAALNVTLLLDNFAVVVTCVALTAGDVPQYELVLATVLFAESGRGGGGNRRLFGGLLSGLNGRLGGGADAGLLGGSRGLAAFRRTALENLIGGLKSNQALQK